MFDPELQQVLRLFGQSGAFTHPVPIKSGRPLCSQGYWLDAALFAWAYKSQEPDPVLIIILQVPTNPS